MPPLGRQRARSVRLWVQRRPLDDFDHDQAERGKPKSGKNISPSTMMIEASFTVTGHGVR
jgi:hypothetical protein